MPLRLTAIYAPNILKRKSQTLNYNSFRIIQKHETFQPKIGRKIRIFSLGRINGVLVKRKECSTIINTILFVSFVFFFLIIFLRYKKPDASSKGNGPTAQSAATRKSSQKSGAGIGFDSRSFKGKSKVQLRATVH